MAKARLAKELNFDAPDKVGLFHEVSTKLAEAGVNIETVTAYEMEGRAYLMMCTSDNAKATEVLKGMGFEVKENEVVLYDIDNKVGAASEMTKKLLDAGVNMKYLVCTTEAMNAPAKLVFSSDNNAKAVEVLNQ